jgi:lysophospholipase L1-like esterase
MRRHTTKICVAVVSLVVSLCVLEAAIRKILPRPGFYVDDQDDVIGLKIPDSRLGFRYVPNFSGRRVTKFSNNEITTNALGLRDTAIEGHSGDTWRILAVGDSFTEGLGVEAVDAWPAQLERLIASNLRPGKRVRVINAGISAYNLRQIRLMADELVPLVNSSIVVAGIYLDEGVGRLENPYVYFNGLTVRRDAVPRLKAVPGGYLYSPFYAPWTLRLDFWLDEYFYTGAHLVKLFQRAHLKASRKAVPAGSDELTGAAMRRRLSPLLDEISLLKRDADGLGQELILLLINSQHADGTFLSASYNGILRQYCQSRDIIHVVNPLPRLQSESRGIPVFRFSDDGHWNAAAHKIAAESVLQLLPDIGHLAVNHTVEYVIR